MEFLIDALGKTIIVGGFRYLAIHTDYELINGLSLVFIFILSNYITLRLAEMAWITLAFSFLDDISLSDQSKTIVVVSFSLLCFFRFIGLSKM